MKMDQFIIFLLHILILQNKNKYEETIRNDRKILRTLVDNLPIAIYIIDKEGRKIISNKADLENIGFHARVK